MRESDLLVEYRSIVKAFREHVEHRLRKASPVRTSSLRELYSQIRDCQQCPLCKRRKNLVFGEGNADATVMFVGEGPGRDEDIRGKPFVGMA